MHLLYVVRPGEGNEELRYSLRSLVNVEHESVTIAGYCPSWVTNVRYIPVEQGNKIRYLNSMNNLLAACRHEDMPEDLVLFNDDMFVMQPVTSFPLVHRGNMRASLKGYRPAHSDYVVMLTRTIHYLHGLGVSPALSFALHTPMPFKKTFMQKVIEDFAASPFEAVSTRSLYGNLCGEPASYAEDVKVSREKDLSLPYKSWPVVSTAKRTFKKEVGDYIREVFSNPGPYELSNIRASEVSHA